MRARSLSLSLSERLALFSRLLASRVTRCAPFAICAIRISRGSAHTAYYARLAFLVLVRHRCRCRCRCIPSRFGAVAYCSWHSFWSSPIASGTRDTLRWTCVRFSFSSLVPFTLHPRPFPDYVPVRRRPTSSGTCAIAVSRNEKNRAPKRSEYRSAIFGDI